MTKTVSVIVNNAEKRFPSEIVEIKGQDESQFAKDSMLKSVAFLAAEILSGRIVGFAAMTINDDGQSTSSIYTGTCLDDVHRTLAGLEILKDRFKDECIGFDEE